MSSYSMINVGPKPVTHRIAVATGRIRVGAEAFKHIVARTLPKGDVLMLCEIAGIQGAKNAANTMVLCHPLPLDHVGIRTEPEADAHAIRVFCTVSCHGRTGVEMEALAGVNAALLNIWDLTKMIEPDLLIEDVRLLAKVGGKSGLWLSGGGVPDWVMTLTTPETPQVLTGRKAAVVTLSDRASRGEYEDKSGAILAETLSAHGATVIELALIPDEVSRLTQTVQTLVAQHAPHLIICTGGTGVAERDLTPEALLPLFDKVIPGVGELLRADGSQYTPLSWSSRAVGGLIGKTLVVALPGSPRAVEEALSALLPKLLPHLIRIAHGEDK